MKHTLLPLAVIFLSFVSCEKENDGSQEDPCQDPMACGDLYVPIANSLTFRIVDASNDALPYIDSIGAYTTEFYVNGELYIIDQPDAYQETSGTILNVNHSYFDLTNFPEYSLQVIFRTPYGASDSINVYVSYHQYDECCGDRYIDSMSFNQDGTMIYSFGENWENIYSNSGHPFLVNIPFDI